MEDEQRKINELVLLLPLVIRKLIPLNPFLNTPPGIGDSPKTAKAMFGFN